MEVKKIPVDIQCLLSASAKVNNYRRAVEELVYNSLDAESTCIAIRIHMHKSWIQVVDNGIGIKNADYKFLGERYATSKLLDINTLKAVPSKYGYQGQALANIIEVSHTVKITSRCPDSSDTWVKTFLKGKTEREFFKGTTRSSKGTTIEINGFLYNLNIQRKCLNAFNEIQDIKMFLEQLTLVLNNVSISLRDESENEIIFKMHKNRNIYQTLNLLFDINTNDFQELQIEKNEYKVKAFIGVDKKGTKNCHWIYLNNKYINISNLHRIINNKFTKVNRMKQRKIKAKESYKYNDDTAVGYEFVPFYFLFLTCPFYEYDIVISGKQTTVEFKVWVRINNLIEKLVKFYNGDINLANLEKNDNQKQVSAKVSDTRDEVKKIMEKILKRPNKIVRVSQLQNGIKGKQVRRKKKKHKVNIFLKRTKLPVNNTPYKNIENIDNLKSSENNVTKKPGISNPFKVFQSKYSNANTQPEKKTKYKNKTNIKNHKISKTSVKCKCTKNHKNLIEIFKNNTSSIKRRCDELSCHLKDLLNVKNCEKINDLSITPIKNKSAIANTAFKNTAEFKQFNDNKKIVSQQIRSYDLLQPIINTQQDFYNQEPRKDEFMSTNKSNVPQTSYRQCYYSAPKRTFESHHYNNGNTIIEKKLPQIVKFISKQSIGNFNIGAKKHEENIQFKKSTFNKYHGLFNANTNKKQYVSKFNNILNKYQLHGLKTSFSIDTSGTDIIEFSKQIRNQLIHDMKSFSDNRKYNKINNSKSQRKSDINLNIEKTYTFLMDSFYNCTQAITTSKNRKTCINKTVNYTNVSYHDLIYSNNVDKTSNEIFITAPQYPFKLGEPLDICEAILSSSENIDDYNNNMTKHDSPLIIKKCRSLNKPLKNNNTGKSQTNSSTKNNYSEENSTAIIPNKEYEEKNVTVKVINDQPDQVGYRYEKLGFNEIDTVQDNCLYNFKLNSRHRFVPKGMSQIFKNCFSKTNCSYNLNTEYYDTTIYNNFVEDVAVNSEIFEPNLRNLKECTTEDLQKVTEKLKKYNADLIFGSDSLRSAKVLGQVDCKYITAILQNGSQTHKSPQFLVCFDQHAVHERIKLEKNLADYFNDNNWKKVTIDTISLKSSKHEILYLHNHKDKFTRFGLDWTVLNNSEILVNAIPEAIRGKNPRPMEIIIRTVKDLILEQIHAIKYLKGNVSLYPQSIMNLVFSEACRYAIKFGDKLSTQDCIQLIAALADCNTPFQCAHGRPVMAVIVELKNEKFVYKANMDNIIQFKNRIKK